MWWPKCDRDVENVVQISETYLAVKNSPMLAPLHL